MASKLKRITYGSPEGKDKVQPKNAGPSIKNLYVMENLPDKSSENENDSPFDTPTSTDEIKADLYIVMDSARIHKTPEALTSVRDFGHTPYPPFFINPIEEC
ncbi:hypothetical protein BDC45DRAFT_572015 [Circinella umbellata]|nr:hypothetical protein BDC45DRAFT_572015 [Circinella umbellata]